MKDTEVWAAKVVGLIDDIGPPTFAPRKAENRPSTGTGADPLGLCPPALRPRYARLAQQVAKGRYRAAAKLKCLDCCAWAYQEARRCEIQTCPLWTANRRIFVRRAEAAEG